MHSTCTAHYSVRPTYTILYVLHVLHILYVLLVLDLILYVLHVLHIILYIQHLVHILYVLHVLHIIMYIWAAFISLFKDENACIRLNPCYTLHHTTSVEWLFDILDTEGPIQQDTWTTCNMYETWTVCMKQAWNIIIMHEMGMKCNYYAWNRLET